MVYADAGGTGVARSYTPITDDHDTGRMDLLVKVGRHDGASGLMLPSRAQL